MNKNNIFDQIEQRNQIGFSNFSEKINGRLAMLSFIAIFLLELFSKQKLFDLFIK